MLSAEQILASPHFLVGTVDQMVSYLIPKDAPLSTVQHAAPAPAALPATGGAAEGALPIWLLVLAASGLIAGGWFVRRQQALRDI